MGAPVLTRRGRTRSEVRPDHQHDTGDDPCVGTVEQAGVRAATAHVAARHEADKRHEGGICPSCVRSVRPARLPARRPSGTTDTVRVAAGTQRTLRWPLRRGWYDVTITCDAEAAFLRRLAGHVENGRPSVTDPSMGNG